MTVPAVTVYGSRPRCFFRDTDKTALTARTDDASGWKPIWDATIIPAANTYKAYTPLQIVGITNPHLRMMVLALAGYIEETGRPSSGYKDAAIDAAVFLADLADDEGPTIKRYRVLALALVLDILFADMTTSEKDQVAANLAHQCDRMSYGWANERMDGHSGNDQMCQAIGALAGYGYGSWDWSARLTEALTFWYGPGEGVDEGRIATPRYFCDDGGSFKGGWYTYLGLWGELWLATALKNGTTTIDMFTSETWMAKMWEWILWEGFSGGDDDDFLPEGDTAKITSPKFMNEMRWALGILATRFPTPDSTEGGKHLRWLYDQWDALDSDYADNLIFDVIFLDKGSVAAVAPKDAATPLDTSRIFAPPGSYFYREEARGGGGDAWEHDDSVQLRISGRKWYDIGHRHLDAAAVQISFKGDRLLLAPAGVYDAFGTSHHLNAYQRTWLQSLCPLVLDASQVFQHWSNTVANDGGQHYKKYDGASDPGNVYDLQNDEGGLAWLRSTLTKVSEDASTVFLTLDVTPAYAKEWDASNRVSNLRIKYLVIKPTAANGLVYPALLYYARIQKTNSDHRTIIPLHSAAAWTTTSYGGHTVGSRNDGKLWVDLRDIAIYTLTNDTPGTPLDANGYGPDQFKIPGGGTVNYKPSSSPRAREVPDLKKHSLYVERTTREADERYVLLLMPTGSGDSEPVSGRAWVTDAAQPDWYGITIGSTTYLVHRTLDLISTGTPDSTPPAEVSAEALVAKDSALLATWTDPVDADYAKAHVYIRTSAIL